MGRLCEDGIASVGAPGSDRVSYKVDLNKILSTNSDVIYPV